MDTYTFLLPFFMLVCLALSIPLNDPLLSIDVSEMGEGSYWQSLQEHLDKAATPLEKGFWYGKDNFMVFLECSRLIIQDFPIEQSCIGECHPPIDCKEIAWHQCSVTHAFNRGQQNWYECLESEMDLCQKSGNFRETIKFPSWSHFKLSWELTQPKSKKPDRLEYCSLILQMRGMRLPCLIECSVFYLKYGNKGALLRALNSKGTLSPY